MCTQQREGSKFAQSGHTKTRQWAEHLNITFWEKGSAKTQMMAVDFHYWAQ